VVLSRSRLNPSTSPAPSVDYPDSVSTYANGINQQGDIVGRYTDTDGKTHGFIAKHFVE
jgi:hypothetical protein